MANPAADRALVSLCVDCAARINHDGKSITLISDADAILQWMEQRLADRAKLDPLRSPALSGEILSPSAANPMSRQSVMSELNDLLSRDAGGRKKEP